MLVARLQSGKTFGAGRERGGGWLHCALRLGLELGVTPHDTDVALEEVFLARVALEGASLPQKSVVDPTLKLTIAGQPFATTLTNTHRQ